MANTITINDITTDNTISASELDGLITISGTANANSDLFLMWQVSARNDISVEFTATSDSGGLWQTTLDPSTLTDEVTTALEDGYYRLFAIYQSDVEKAMSDSGEVFEMVEKTFAVNIDGGSLELTDDQIYAGMLIDPVFSDGHIEDTMNSRFENNIGQGVTINYSFATSGSRTDFSAFTDAGKVAARAALKEFSDNIGGLTFNEVDSGGDLQFAMFATTQALSNGAVESGNFFPFAWEDTQSEFNQYEFGGTVNISTDKAEGNWAVGEYGYFLLIHEIGHALGLDHPYSNDYSDPNKVPLPEYYSNAEFTMMADTRDSLGDFDIKVLQYIYGTTASSETVNVDSVGITPDNSAPEFTSDASNISFDEGNSEAVDVYTAVASDTDGDPLTYSLSGTDAASFSINGTTGVVSFTGSADYEQKSSYAIKVSATDGAATTDQSISVKVNNLNDEEPAFDELTVTASIRENLSVATVIHDADATDADGNTLTYGLSGADADLLNIDSTTGEVTLKASADYESEQKSYQFSVTASDGVNTVASQDVTVSVTDDTSDNSIVDYANDGYVMSQIVPLVKLHGDSGKSLKDDVSIKQHSSTHQHTHKTGSGSLNLYNTNSSEYALEVDADTTGAVGISDVIAQLRHIVGLDTLTGVSAANADVDMNDAIEISDVIGSLRMIVGLEDATKARLVDSQGNHKFSNETLPGELFATVIGDVDLSWTGSDLV